MTKLHMTKLHMTKLHMTKLRNFTKEVNRDFSAFRISLQLMLEQALTNLTICLMIPQKRHKKRDSMLQWILGRFGFSLKKMFNETSKKIELIKHL